MAIECDHLRGTMLDAAAMLIPSSPEFQRHISECAKCSSEFDALRRTMDLLDEWRVPHPSPRFYEQLSAKLAKVKTVTSTGWRLHLPPTVIALSIAVLLLVAAITPQRTKAPPAMAYLVDENAMGPSPGSAVGDLQSLLEADELFADFDLLDELAPDQQNPSSQQ